MNIKTFIFLDLETTGLPNQDGNTTKITELCLIAVLSDHILSGNIPRVQNKLILCFNPKKTIDPEAARISQLSNDILRDQPVLDSKTGGIIKEFIEQQAQPVCFVCHYGQKFDYPVLRGEIHNTGTELPGDLLCIDTFVAFKEMYYQDIRRGAIKKAFLRTKVASKAAPESNEELEKTKRCEEVESELQSNNDVLDGSKKLETFSATTMHEIKENKVDNGINKDPFYFQQLSEPSFKLVNLYRILTLRTPTDAHQAEYDCKMLMECALVLNERFVNWANANAKKFQTIPLLRP